MARRKSLFAKSNKGKAGEVLLHNMFKASSKSKRSGSSSSKSKRSGSSSSPSSVELPTSFAGGLYMLLIFISWGVVLLYLFSGLLKPKNFSFINLVVFSLIPISLHLIKFFFKSIKEERAKKKESKPILDEKSLESDGVKDLQGVDLAVTEIPLETTTTNRFVDREVSITEAITDRVEKLESMARPKCGICNKWLKNDWEDKIISTQSTFKKNVFSIKGFFFTLFSLGLWVFVAILIDLIKWGRRYVINKFRCQCDLRANT